MDEILDLIWDIFHDSIKVFVIAFVIYVILSFFEGKLTRLMERHKRTSPIIGAASGLIPQCGVSVVAADLYIKEHISMGTIIAVFFACSDEALPILFSGGEKAMYVIPLILIKFVIGFTVGYLTDLFIKAKKEKFIEGPLEESHIGCCGHEIDHDENESKIHEHLVHPLIHSLKIFAYVLVVNAIFGVLIYFIGEESLVSFIETNTWLSPLFSALVGLIPNCASSVVITELFINGMPFGAMLSGLCVNAGLGLVYLLKNKKNWKDVLLIVGILFASSVLTGYITMLIMQLF